ncbi:MAG: M2 family metallopeptidase [Rhodothermaceae bacterium]|nr:M2 family metallopeptidase [Rhodothermaceae bacterium]
MSTVMPRCSLSRWITPLVVLLISTTVSSAQSSMNATVAEAVAFADSAETLLYDLGVKAGRAAWVQANFITHDTEILAAEANEAYVAAAVGLATEAARFNGLDLDYDTARKLNALRTSLTMPAPNDAAKTAELSQISARMESTYGRGEYCPDGADGECLSLPDMSQIMAQSRDADELLDVWTGWRTVSPAMRTDYQRFVDLMNEGARDLGFTDVGAMWRSNYDMDPDDFAAELDRLWGQVQPLYEGLHCYVRAGLAEEYGEDTVPLDEPLPAHLLGNMWAQQWGNIYDLVAPASSDPGYDLTELIDEEGMDAIEMVQTGERFFTSLGLDPLPETFYERSLFTKPADRDVVCHASAWDLDDQDDLRIKMCIEPNAEDFQTIHHELGHNYYQRAYKNLTTLYRGSANDGFHEALGDAVALSVTPAYLVELGLLDEEPPASSDIGLLLRDALDKIAFLPFGLLVDQYRWKVFSGEIGPDEYNAAWWELREQYQGIQAPNARTEDLFDPGAKYHVPANVPYTRYFLAHILQFQFHRSLCEAAGYEGPLNRCSIYGNEEAGRRLDAMMQMGASRPWPEALEALTGSPEMDATAIIDYFAPLMTWLDEQNAGRSCGW